MKEFTVSEFRRNIREALNAVEVGDMVVIHRHGKDFVLTTASHWNDKQVQAQRGFTTLVTDEVSSDIRPDYVVGMDTGSDDGDATVIAKKTKQGLKIVDIKHTPPSKTPATVNLKPAEPEKNFDLCKHGNVKKFCKLGCK